MKIKYFIWRLCKELKRSFVSKFVWIICMKMHIRKSPFFFFNHTSLEYRYMKHVLNYIINNNNNNNNNINNNNNDNKCNYKTLTHFGSVKKKRKELKYMIREEVNSTFYRLNKHRDIFAGWWWTRRIRLRQCLDAGGWPNSRPSSFKFVPTELLNMPAKPLF